MERNRDEKQALGPIEVSHPQSSRTLIPSMPSEAEAYKCFFAEVAEAAVKSRQVDRQSLAEYRIALSQERFQGQSLESVYQDPKVVLINLLRGASIVNYSVLIGAYIVQIRMLNADDEISRPSEKAIASGAYGSILPVADGKETFVAKRMKFSIERKREGQFLLGDPTIEVIAWFRDVKDALVEYSIAKVCSMLKIGPKVKTDIGFDVVCYRDCLEFYMQACQPALSIPWRQEVHAKRLKYCVKVMHQHRLIHRDIKPGNILFSPSVNDLVLCDFGISHPVIEAPGHKTPVSKSGTNHYMSPELRQMCVKTNGKELVDIYSNDMYALKRTFEEFATNRQLRSGIQLNQGMEATDRIKRAKEISRESSDTLRHGDSSQSTVADPKQMQSSLMKPLDIRFLLNSMGKLSFDIYYFLLDPSIEHNPIARNLRQHIELMARKNLSNKTEHKVSQVHNITCDLRPVTLLVSNELELSWLNNQTLRTAENSVKRWILMAEYICIHATDLQLSEQFHKTYQSFKSEKVLPGQRMIETNIEVLTKIGRYRESYTEIFQDIQSLFKSGNMRYMSKAIECFWKRGDKQGGFEVIKRFGGISDPMNYGWLLYNLVILSDGLTLDQNVEQLSNRLQALESSRVETSNWDWLIGFHMLCLAYLSLDPAKCLQLCKAYIGKIQKSQRGSVLFMMVWSCTSLGMVEQAYEWQKRLSTLFEERTLFSKSAAVCAQMILLRLQGDNPQADYPGLFRRTWNAISLQKSQVGWNPTVATLYNFSAELLIRQKMYGEADRLLEPVVEQKIARLRGSVGILQFYSHKLQAILCMFDESPQKPERDRLLARMDELVQKAAPWVSMCGDQKASACYLLLLMSNSEWKHERTAQAVRYLHKAIDIAPRPMSEVNFSAALTVAKLLLFNLVAANKISQANKLYRCIADLKLKCFNSLQRSRLLIRKLGILIDYGGVASNQEFTRLMVEECASQLDFGNEEIRVALYKMATSFSAGQRHSDAAYLFGVVPEPKEAEYLVARATSIYCNNRKEEGARLFLQLLKSVDRHSIEYAKCSLYMCLYYFQKSDHETVDIYLKQSYEVYLKWHKVAVRLNAKQCKAGDWKEYRDTYSIQLRTLIGFLSIISQSHLKRRRALAVRLTKKEAYYLKVFGLKTDFPVSRYLQLCECDFRLKRISAALRSLVAIQSRIGLGEYSQLFSVLEQEKAWYMVLAISGRMPNKCPEEVTNALARLLGKGQPCEMSMKETLVLLVNTKKVGKALRILARIKGGMPSASKELLSSCEIWLSRFISKPHKVK